ncbi:MAG: AAA family ATPase [Rhodospirillales bacterium]|nr:AAA family ATPase [Rhodospirillales bacterium]
MYERFFGLTEPPFSIAPDPRYLYMSDKHREALAHLLYGITHGGFVLLTGEVGTGKTTICRCLLEQLPADTELAFVFNPKLTAAELLETLCDEYRIARPLAGPGGAVSIKALIDAINTHLLAQHARGRTCVLIIDEAQNLAADVLEQMRLLTNLETNERKLMQIMMIGQPELRTMLKRPDLRQLAQRITARYHLGALSAKDTAAYVARRLEVAGVERRLFPPRVLARLHHHTGGVPRLINLIADRALLGAYVQGEPRVSMQTLDRAAGEILDGMTSASHWRSRRRVVVAGGGVALAAAATAAVLIVPTGLVAPVTAAWQRATMAWQLATADADPLPGASPAETAPAAAPEPELAAVTAPVPAPVTASVTAPGQPPEPSEPRTPTIAAAEPPPGPAADEAPAAEPGEAAIVLARAVVDAVDDPRPAPASGQVAPPAPLDTLDWPQHLPLTASEPAAYRAVLARWGIDYHGNGAEACAVAAAEGLTCLDDVGTLARLASLDRPAVLKLKDRQGRPLLAALVGLSPSTAEIDLGGELRRVAPADLVAEWTGGYTVLWRMPPGYRWPVGVGSEGSVVAWIAKRVNSLNGDVGTPPKLVFDEGLRERVRRFQAVHQLSADGIVGPLTLIALDAATDGGGPSLAATER